MAARKPVTPMMRPAITLEDWELKAPLGDIETRSVNLIKAASERTTLPFKVCDDTQVEA